MLIQKIYDLSAYFPYISSLFANIGLLLGAIVYRESGKDHRWTQVSYKVLEVTFTFMLGCGLLSIGFIAVYGVLALIKWFGLLGL